MTQELAEKVVERLMAADARINSLLGLTLASIEPGRAACQLVVREDLVNSHAVCHGGILFALADTALAYASCSTNRSGVTQAASITFTRPAKLGDVLTATAVLESAGRRASACSVRVTNQKDQLIALVSAANLRFEEPIIEADDLSS